MRPHHSMVPEPIQLPERKPVPLLLFCPEPHCLGHARPGGRCPPSVFMCCEPRCPGHLSLVEKCLPLPIQCGARGCPGHLRAGEVCPPRIKGLP